MSNDYFDSADYTPLVANTLARAESVNAIATAVVTGFDVLPGALPLKQGRVTYAADSGAADAYVVTLTHAPPAYVAGMFVLMKATNANTGASTLNVNGLGVKTIKRYDLSSLQAGDVPAGAYCVLGYDGTYFQLLWPIGGIVIAASAQAAAAAVSAAAALASQSAASTSASASATSAAAALVSELAAAASAVLASSYAGSALRAYLGTVTGTDTITSAYVITAYSTGQLIDFIAAGTNTGAVTININSLGAIAIVDQAGTALVAGMIVSGRRYTATYNGTHFRLAGPDASQAVAEAATDNVARMTALRTSQQVQATIASQAEAEAGVVNTTLMTPLRSAQAISALGGDIFTLYGTTQTANAGFKGAMDCSSTARTLDLMAAPAVGQKSILFKKVGTKTLTININGGKKVQLRDGTIQTGGTVTISGPYAGIGRFDYVGTIAAGTTEVWSLSL